MNRFVYEIMKDTYLWYKTVPDIDYTAYASPEELLEDLMNEGMDKYSYIVSKADFYLYFGQGKYIGTGYGMKFDIAGFCRVSYVYNNSPAQKAGLSRGCIILGINGKTIDEIQAGNLWDTIHGKDEIGVPVTLKIEFPGNVIKEIQL
ncbi:MAG: peptidase, partial [bacterium]|nr:peptidase [bacterium]